MLPPDCLIRYAFLTHNAPHPALSDGTGTDLNGTAPRMSCAFILAPYIYGSLPFTIPHCIRSAAVPVTNGAAMDVPLWTEYPPPGAGDIIFTPGATISGFTVRITLVYPRPENRHMNLYVHCMLRPLSHCMKLMVSSVLRPDCFS